MATREVTITLDQGEVERVRALVAAGRARSVSGFVQDAVTVARAEERAARVTIPATALAQAVRRPERQARLRLDPSPGLVEL